MSPLSWHTQAWQWFALSQGVGRVPHLSSLLLQPTQTHHNAAETPTSHQPQAARQAATPNSTPRHCECNQELSLEPGTDHWEVHVWTVLAASRALWVQPRACFEAGINHCEIQVWTDLTCRTFIFVNFSKKQLQTRVPRNMLSITYQSFKKQLHKLHMHTFLC